MFFSCFVNHFGKIYNWWQDKNEYFTTKSAKINPFFFAYFSWFLFLIVKIKFKFNFMPPWDKETGWRKGCPLTVWGWLCLQCLLRDCWRPRSGSRATMTKRAPGGPRRVPSGPRQAEQSCNEVSSENVGPSLDIIDSQSLSGGVRFLAFHL